MKIISSEFITSVNNIDKIQDFNLPEIAIAGRSNVGKSTFINFITNKKALAKVSQTAGKTRFLNYFKINDLFYFVDLPGYGYAKVGNKEKILWSHLINDYLLKSKNLIHIFILLDIRHKPTKQDMQMFNFVEYYKIPHTIILNKIDKLSKQQQNKNIDIIIKELNVDKKDIITVSSTKKIGKEAICSKLSDIITV